MTLITDLDDIAVVGTVDGTEEYVLQKGPTEYKISGTNIVKSVNDALLAYIGTNDTAVNANIADKLDKTGGTLTGFITLHLDPTAALHAATKQYVDGLIATKVDATGGILDSSTTGVTAAATIDSTVLATTEYVGDRLNYEVTKKTAIAAGSYSLADTDRGNIFVDHTATGTVALSLPDISTLTSPERVEYYIIDSGLNAEINNITITAFAGQTINGLTTLVLSSDGESVILATNGGTKWIIKDKVSLTSDTKEGIIATATTSNALLLTETSTAITPGTLGEVLENRLYNFVNVGIASKVVSEADAGSEFYVTQTLTGACNITLPNPVGGITDSDKFSISIWDAGLAGTNSITITPTGSLIDGSPNFVISDDRAGLKIFTDGTNYFTIANTARASVLAATASSLSGVLSGGNTTGAFDISIDTGQTITYNNSGFTATIAEPTLAGNIAFTLPTVGGTIATTTSVLALAGGSMTGNITMATGTSLVTSNGGFTGTIAEATLAANAVYTLPATTGTLELAGVNLPLVGGTITGNVEISGATRLQFTGSDGWISLNAADDSGLYYQSASNRTFMYAPVDEEIYLSVTGAQGNVTIAANYLQLKNVTTVERDALIAMHVGALVGNGNTGTLDYYDGAAWGSLATATDLSSYLPTAGGTLTGDLALTGSDILLDTTKQIKFGATGNYGILEAAGKLFFNSGGLIAMNNQVAISGKLSTTQVTISTESSQTGPGAVPIDKGRNEITTNATGNALTLANAVDFGAIITLIYVAETAPGDTAILIPTTRNGYASITFNDIGDTVTLVYGDTIGWSIMSVYNATIA